MNPQIWGMLLTGLAVGLGIYSMGNLIHENMTRWRERFLEDAEMEIDEMLLQVPASKVLNYSFAVATAFALMGFLVIAPGEDGFNWQFGLMFAIIIFIVVMLMARLFLKFLKKQRLQKFNDQLEEALMSMSNALRAGFSINQALEMVIKQKKQPISIEFKLMMQQTRLGESFDKALKNMALRVESEDFALVASAIITARQTGGDLTGVFDRLADMIRERLRIQRRIRTLTAQGRLQGIVLGCLPMMLLGVLYLLDPQMIREFFTTPMGIFLFVIVVLLEAGGFLVIRKIVNIDI